MKIEFSFRPDEGRSLRGLLMNVALPLGVLVGSVTLVFADVPNLFKQGDALSSSKLNDNFAALDARLKALEAENAALKGEAPCPPGFTHDTSEASFTLCKKGLDEVVKVGTGLSAFWVDRYEASVWSTPDEKGQQFGTGTNDIFPGVEKNGEWANAPLYAVSRKGVEPSQNMTWFQAAAFCRASGKRLPTGEEWLAAGMGMASKDPGSSPGEGGKCNTQSNGPRNTGGGTACRSRWGAEDMIGNVWEMTNEWYAAPGGAKGTPLFLDFPDKSWPPGYKDDGVSGIASAASDLISSGATLFSGIPSMGLRGGNWGGGIRAGLFLFTVTDAPTRWDKSVGFRCLLRT